MIVCEHKLKNKNQKENKKMSEQLKRNPAEKALMIAGAVAAIATGNALANPGQAEAIQSLRNVTELPGYKLSTVSPEVRQKLEDSTVQLKSRYISDANYPYEVAGSAVSVKLPGQNPNIRYFLSSNRSIGVGPESGSFKVSNLKAGNYINITGKEFGLFDPFAGGALADIPFGQATGISVNTNGNDVSMMQVESTGDIEQTGMRLSDVASIAYKGMNKARLGQKMAVDVLDTGSKVPVKTVGRYVGTSQIKDEETGVIRTIDFVGIKANTLSADGSIAASKNATTGPLSFVINTGIGENDPVVARTAKEVAEAQLEKRAIEQDLEVDLSGYKTIFAYGRVNPSTMVAGLKVFAEQYGAKDS